MSDILTRIAQQREERVQDLHLDLPIPTWDGALVARFEVLPRKDMEIFARRKAGSEADQDFLIRCTKELYVLDPGHEYEGQRMEDNDDYARIEDDQGRAVTWSEVLADKLGKPEFTKARDVLVYCFKGNMIALSGMAVRCIKWMQNTDAEVAEAISGE